MKLSFLAVVAVCAASCLGASTWKPPSVDRSANRVKTTLNVGLERIGTLVQRSVSEIGESGFMVGCETLDRGFADFEAYKDYLPPLGISKIRIQAGWARCEKEKGVFDFAWLDKIVDWSVANGLQPMMCVVFGNPLYCGDESQHLHADMPHEGEAWAAYQRWVMRLTEHFGSRVRDWETWNEPNNNPNNTPEIIVKNNIFTAETILKHRPDARITGICIGLRDWKNVLPRILQLLQASGKSGLFTYFACHRYTPSPELDVEDYEWQLGLMRQYAPTVKLRDSEGGAPSQMLPKFGFSRWAFTEISQAKWNMRRLLVDHSLGLDAPVFGISDMHYRSKRDTFNNAKGLLRTNDRNEVIQIKKAYYAVQHVASVFDRTLVKVPSDTSAFRNHDAAIWFDEYRNAEGRAVLAFWEHEKRFTRDGHRLEIEHPQPSDSCVTRTFTFDGSGRRLEHPVWVDLLTGAVYEFPAENQIEHACGITFVNVPVYDSPCLLAERAALKFQ